MLVRDDGICAEVRGCIGEAVKNAFYTGDAACIAKRLSAEYAGKIQCIYLDPPFMTGNRFRCQVRVGARDWKTQRGSLELNAYDDSSSREEYLSLMRRVLTSCKTLLSDKGLIFLHIDWHVQPYLRILMDEIFGENHFLNEIIWAYQSGGRSKRYFSRKHDTILLYAKTADYFFTLNGISVGESGTRLNHMKKHTDADGRTYRTIRSGGRLYTYYDDEPVAPGDVWSDISHLQQRDPQRTGYDTQKPLKLLDRIIRCSTREGDLVLDLFGGSGTTAEAAYLANRRFILADSNPLSLQLVRRRTGKAPCAFHFEKTNGKPSVDASLSLGVGIARVKLNRFRLEENAASIAPEGLDALDSWALGYEKNQVFYAYAWETRARETPELRGALEIPVFEGKLMLRVTDVLGRDFYYAVAADELHEN